jgi:hypothetical protein
VADSRLLAQCYRGYTEALERGSATKLGEIRNIEMLQRAKHSGAAQVRSRRGVLCCLAVLDEIATFGRDLLATASSAAYPKFRADLADTTRCPVGMPGGHDTDSARSAALLAPGASAGNRAHWHNAKPKGGSIHGRPASQLPSPSCRSLRSVAGVRVNRHPSILPEAGRSERNAAPDRRHARLVSPRRSSGGAHRSGRPNEIWLLISAHRADRRASPGFREPAS